MNKELNILIIDNYDSFTYNLVHQIEKITGQLPDVYRNDAIEIDAIAAYDLIVLSPGPGIPDEAGILKEVIKTYAGIKPIFGVCLGLQAIVEVCGGTILNMDEVFHGVATEMSVTASDAILFKGLSSKFMAARYHSWIADKAQLPDQLTVTATDENGGIMAIEHKEYPLHAVQFHPESILTPDGDQMLSNVIEMAVAFKPNKAL